MSEYAFLFWVLAAVLMMTWAALGGGFIHAALASAGVAVYLTSRNEG